jgi:hypothetical protein
MATAVLREHNSRLTAPTPWLQGQQSESLNVGHAYLVGHTYHPSKFHALASQGPMSKLLSRDHEQMQLNRLLAMLPYLQQQYPDPADFWPDFAGLADLIIDAVGPDDFGKPATDGICNRVHAQALCNTSMAAREMFTTGYYPAFRARRVTVRLWPGG